MIYIYLQLLQNQHKSIIKPESLLCGKIPKNIFLSYFVSLVDFISFICFALNNNNNIKTKKQKKQSLQLAWLQDSTQTSTNYTTSIQLVY